MWLLDDLDFDLSNLTGLHVDLKAAAPLTKDERAFLLHRTCSQTHCFEYASHRLDHRKTRRLVVEVEPWGENLMASQAQRTQDLKEELRKRAVHWKDFFAERDAKDAQKKWDGGGQEQAQTAHGECG